MNDPLSIAETVLLEAVSQLFQETAVPVELPPESVKGQEVIVGTIGFAGTEARGAITVTGTVTAWRRLAPAAMGTAVSDATICDSVGEVANMLAGRFRNGLLRLGVEILVATPVATRGPRLSVHANDGATTFWHDKAFAGAAFRLRFDLSLAEGFEFEGREATVVDPSEQDLVLF